MQRLPLCLKQLQLVWTEEALPCILNSAEQPPRLCCRGSTTCPTLHPIFPCYSSPPHPAPLLPPPLPHTCILLLPPFASLLVPSSPAALPTAHVFLLLPPPQLIMLLPAPPPLASLLVPLPRLALALPLLLPVSIKSVAVVLPRTPSSVLASQSHTATRPCLQV